MTAKSGRDDDTKLTRRALLTSTGAIAAGVAVAGCEYKTQFYLLSDAPESEATNASWQGSSVVARRPLGRTGFDMSDISFGTSKLQDPAVARRAIERGINYFDTSPDYSDAASERALGEGIKGIPRDQLFIASKFCSPDGHLDDDTPVPEVIAAVEGSLKRLQVDHLDLVHVHAVNSVDRLMAPNLHEAFDRLKEQGKVRFLGVSSHTPRLEEVMRHAVDSDRFDVIMVAYNFKNWPKLHDIFHDAHEKGIGVVAMKTLKGAYHSQLADFTATDRESFSQAAFKWVLANPDVSGLVISIAHFPQIDEYLYASGKAPTKQDVALLEKYDESIAKVYCRPGCGECLESCPADVPVDDLLRYRMYAESYGQERDAMRAYAKVDPDRTAANCATCPAPCEPACPFEIPIRERLVETHRLLRWA
ncbi:MAG: aldo/keto reductase [Candidatus Binatia bacterium]|nr:aldo/keto reductase [Candidatus Binatia bacterium]